MSYRTAASKATTQKPDVVEDELICKARLRENKVSRALFKIQESINKIIN